MDRVRLGRALGYGTRHAAKTLVAVAEAAAAPGPPAAATREPAAAGPRPEVSARRRASTAGAGRAMWGSVATFSGALWLRVTGVFFAVIALAMANGAWRTRGAWRDGGGATGHFWMFAGFGLLFGYFAVSSFLRAGARERRGR